jgi:galactose-1-phosphate uridylyltransferase
MPEDRGRPGESLTRLPDGTIKQVSPVTGTVVWTVPGRADRPIPVATPAPSPLPPGAHLRTCAFCPERMLETPPERARLVRTSVGDRTSAGRAPDQNAAGRAAAEDDTDPGPATGTDLPGWRALRELPADALADTTAEFRRIPNLYPILPWAYWRADHGLEASAPVEARARAYAASAAGRAHLAGLLTARGDTAGTWGAAEPASEELLVASSLGMFASTHDLVVARRHYTDGATTDDQLCASGDLTADEHLAFLALTVDAARDLTESNPHARYVAVFQNWLRPAGASFDHLHKQLVAIDEWGPLMTGVADRLARRPQLFNDEVVDVAARHRLVVAENDHAVALAGIGHRYPTLELYATGPAQRPWEHPAELLRAMSDLLHACHAATGSRVATNEEWHYRPVGSQVAMPWRINLKWRVSTLAGFEGGTRINVNTIDPFTLRDRVVDALVQLREAGRISAVRIGDECAHRGGMLRYAGA